jgi:hypothetical protein
MNTKTDGISSGLVASIYLAFSDDGENIRFWTSNAFHAVEWAQENWETEAFVRLSDAEAIIATKDAEIEQLTLYKNLADEYGLSVFADLKEQDERIKELESELEESDAIRDRCAHLLAETAVALKGPEKALHRHGWQDLPEVAAKQSAALKLAREALFDMQDSYAAVHGWKDSFVIAATTAIAAIDSLQKGE